MSNKNEISTVGDFIESGTTELLTYYNLSTVQQIGDIIYSVDNVIYDYLDELKHLSLTVEMTDLEYIKYKFRPELLSYDLYGTTELYFVILAINGLYTPKEFTIKTLKLLPKDLAIEVVNTIYNTEESYLKFTKNKLNETKEEE